MKTTVKTIVILLLIFFVSQEILAATNYVSTTGGNNPPYLSWANAARNIQDAINVAATNDTVLVANGTYVAGGALTPGYSINNRVMIDKAITVKSLNGAAVTMIKGEGPMGAGAVRCAYLTNGAQLIGFTLTNGYTHTTGDFYFERSCSGALLYNGGIISNCMISGNTSEGYSGGVYCYRGGAINSCTISGNTANGKGGGVFLHYGGEINDSTISDNLLNMSGGGAGVSCENGGVINNCTITGNTGTGSEGYGGGVYCENGGAVSNSTISGNSANWSGGGVCLKSDGTVYGCTISGNSSGSGGGGVICISGGSVYNSTISGNTADVDGGGVYCGSGSLISDCSINGNSSGKKGGGIKFYSGGTVKNCTITDNTSGTDGGGVILQNNGEMRNCKISGNFANGVGGGVYCYYGGAVKNCTISENTSDARGGGVYFKSGGTILNSIIYYNSATNATEYNDSSTISYCCSPGLSGNDNISGDPLFVDTNTANLRLYGISPCVDAGTNLSWMIGTTDLDGNPRITGGTVDMGAYEAYSPEGTDVFENASVLINTMEQAEANNSSAIIEPGEPAHAGNGGPYHSVWWDWSAPTSTMAIESAAGDILLVDTHGSDFDTVLAVYTGPNVSNLTEITSNDDASPGTNTSKVIFSFVLGETYHIAVDGKTATDTGNVVLNYNIIPEPGFYLLFIIGNLILLKIKFSK